ncbi:VQ motif-containing protein 29-like [Zingiber officinale]|uniref:VQ domain-containing protein n=1 Tax=Zingiber officinale TaxID=94328 RepID=A0A8J5L5G2_ZINOF|nr:VQ motif-containing protein 29-like [Zingiber officinale]KAG6501370.1 hypothetical protein ZIOFF_041249 [Zingiber officinale]
MDQNFDKRQRPSQQPPYSAVLHSVQRQPGKAPHKKPDQSPAPKVYRVDPRGFRTLVQQLTGATHSAAPPPRQRPLRDTAPQLPPLKLAAPVMSGGADHSKIIAPDGQSPTEFLQGLLSPSLYSSWCSFPPLSPAGDFGSMDL